MKSLINRIKKKIMKPERYARYIGVNIGIGNFVADKNCWSSEPYLITIGNYCAITVGVKIFTHGGGHSVRRTYPEFDAFGKVVIGDYVYIGNNSLIMPGVKIGDNVLVAAGSVVTKSVPSNVVVGGNPAKILCSIDAYIERNMKFNLNSKRMAHSEKRVLLLSLSEDKFINKAFLKD